MRVESVAVEKLHEVLGFGQPIAFPQDWRRRPLMGWAMEPDDCVLRYVFRHFRPRRHLEFGTWLGDGVLRCVEECDATVWTINVLQGEVKPDGGWAYSQMESQDWNAPTQWSERLVTNDGIWVRTDAYGAIGRKYLDAGWGRRVCQIYCDSREWDTQAYDAGFFDSVFVDGGHSREVVESDTTQATRLVRSGGLVLWHDYCPDAEVQAHCPSTRDTNAFVNDRFTTLARDFSRLFWVEPSWLLIGIRR